MASSMILGPYNLMSSTSAVQLALGFDRGFGAPIQSEVQSTVLDGAIVTGRAASNRKVAIPLIVLAPDRATLAQLTNTVLQIVDSQTWELSFTPDGAGTVVFDCQRATVSISSPLWEDEQLVQELGISCEAYPFPRSPVAVTTSLGGTSVQLDPFNTAPTVTSSGNVSGLTVADGSGPTPSSVYEGLNALHLGWTEGRTDTHPTGTFTFVKAGMSVAVAGAMTQALIRLQANVARGVQAASLTITTTASSYAASTTLTTIGTGFTGMAFAMAIPAGSTVTGYSLTLTLWALGSTVAPGGGTITSFTLDVDDLRLFPQSTAVVADAYGGIYSLHGIQGSARTSLSLSLAAQDGSTFSCFLLHTPPPETPTARPMIPISSGHGSAPGNYDGTYSIYVGVGAGSGTGVVTVTFTQSTSSKTAAVVSGTVNFAASANGLIYVGALTLPILDYPAENAVTTSVTVSVSAGSLTVNDVLLLDTRGESIICGPGFSDPQLSAWVDAPVAGGATAGAVYAGASRATAFSRTPYLTALRALTVTPPGDSQILIYSPEGHLGEGNLEAVLTYAPRWLQEAPA